MGVPSISSLISQNPSVHVKDLLRLDIQITISTILGSMLSNGESFLLADKFPRLILDRAVAYGKLNDLGKSK